MLLDFLTFVLSAKNNNFGHDWLLSISIYEMYSLKINKSNNNACAFPVRHLFASSDEHEVGPANCQL